MIKYRKDFFIKNEEEKNFVTTFVEYTHWFKRIEKTSI